MLLLFFSRMGFICYCILFCIQVDNTLQKWYVGNLVLISRWKTKESYFKEVSMISDKSCIHGSLSKDDEYKYNPELKHKLYCVNKINKILKRGLILTLSKGGIDVSGFRDGPHLFRKKWMCFRPSGFLSESRLVWICVCAPGKGHLHFYDGGINTERYTQTSEQYMLPSSQHNLQRHPCNFQQSNAKPPSTNIIKGMKDEEERVGTGLVCLRITTEMLHHLVSSEPEFLSSLVRKLYKVVFFI